jgi:hypothetical protein
MLGWKSMLAAAQQALGKDGKLPKPAVDPLPSVILANKAWDAFRTTRTDLEKKLVEVQDRHSQAKHALQQYADLIDGDDFGLDEKKPDDKKRIDAASKVIVPWLNENQAAADEMLALMAKLDRVLTDLQRLKALQP